MDLLSAMELDDDSFAANGCDWDYDTCKEAAGAGRLDILQWAQANGCDWNWQTCHAGKHAMLFHFVQL